MFGLTTGVGAQEVIYSPYEKFDLRSGDFSVIGKIGNRIYTYRATQDGFYLDLYNDSMEKTAMVLLDFFPKKIYETKFVAYADRILTLYQALEGNKVVQYAALLDQNGRLLKGPLHITSERTGILGPTRDYLSSTVSDDKTQIVVYSIEEKGRELQFSGVWLDDQLNINHRATTSFKAENDLMKGEPVVSNDGSLFLPAFTPTGSRNFSDQLWLLMLDKGSRRFRSQEMPLNDLYITSAFIKLDNYNKRVYTSGFYSDKKNGNYEGVIYAWYEMADSSFQNRRVLAFSERRREATGERNLRRAFNNFQIRQLIVKKDGGFVLISEDYSVNLRTNMPGWGGYYSFYYGPFMNQTIREYIYNDIFALSYDGSGNLEWHSFVRKSQYSQEDAGLFSSYALINTGGSLGFLFNDFNTRGSKIQLASMDAQGNVDMHSLAAGTDNDPDWLPRSARQTGLKELVVPCLRRRQLCFAKIVF